MSLSRLIFDSDSFVSKKKERKKKRKQQQQKKNKKQKKKKNKKTTTKKTKTKQKQTMQENVFSLTSDIFVILSKMYMQQLNELRNKTGFFMPLL